MMKDYLVFQLYAPLVSWGTQAVGQERPSEDHPGRSALLGLLASALGIDRQDESQHRNLSDTCKFGTKQYSSGLVLRDFHTAQVPPANKKTHHLFTRRDELREPRLGTILSYRSYLQDSFCIVAVTSSNSDYSTAKLQQALAKPQFHLYLGRKSCPLALPLNPRVIRVETLKQALDNYEIPTAFIQSENNPRYYWEKMEDIGLTENYRVSRYDQPISRQRWQFSSRDEYVCMGDDSCT